MDNTIRSRFESYKDPKYVITKCPLLRSVEEYTKDIAINKDTVRNSSNHINTVIFLPYICCLML